jgi:DeoR family transcriptional regulator of aga operon
MKKNGKRSVLAPERHALILTHLQGNDSASLATLTQLTGSSESTIRRDLLELSAQGSGLRRTHGGVISARLKSSTYEPPALIAAQLHSEAKQRIGEAAARFVSDGQSVLFDSSSTVMEVARAVVRRGLTITAVTNDLAIAQTLNTGRATQVIVTGGKIRPQTNTLYGPPGDTLLESIHVDMLFLGAHAISETGLTESSMEIAEIKKRMITSAKRVVLLADQSKFAGHSFVQICGWERVHVLVTDAAPGRLVEKTLQQMGIDVCVAPSNGDGE